MTASSRAGVMVVARSETDTQPPSKPLRRPPQYPRAARPGSADEAA